MNTNLRNYLKCKLCGDTYKTPVILPCGKTVCARHVACIDNTYQCILCNKVHVVPHEGFLKNEDLEDFIQRESELNKNSLQEAKDNLEQLITTCELLVQDPKRCVNDYYDQIRADLDLKTKNFKQKCLKMIDDHYSEILNKIDHAQQSSNLNLNEFIHLKEKLDKTIKFARDRLNSFGGSSDELKKHYIITKFLYEELHNKILNGKEYVLKQNESLSVLSFCDLFVSDKTVTNEDKLQATIEIKLENLKSLNPDEIIAVQSLNLTDIPGMISTKKQSESTLCIKLVSEVEHQINTSDAIGTRTFDDNNNNKLSYSNRLDDGMSPPPAKRPLTDSNLTHIICQTVPLINSNCTTPHVVNQNELISFSSIKKEIIENELNKDEITFQLVVNEFIKFKENKERRVSPTPCIARNMPWNIVARSNLNNNQECSLGFFLQCDPKDKLK